MYQTNLNIRVDDDLKNNFVYICDELGMSMSTAITIYMKKVCRERRIPFEVSIDGKYERRDKRMDKNVRFEVNIFPESDDDNEIESVKETFNDLDLAIKFLEEQTEDMWHHMISAKNYETQRAIPFWSITVLDDESYQELMLGDMVWRNSYEIMYGSEFSYTKRGLTRLDDKTEDAEKKFKDLAVSDGDIGIDYIATAREIIKKLLEWG